ncbi:dihydrodipicolinate synthase family protein [Methylobacillus methanolivorans]|uniref:Dihydrodipicolinate synthase family protein n=1 Tax=Methylobacillus methanolivorans TaxID=1848927 RepID=A0ABW8GKS5_9PROT
MVNPMQISQMKFTGLCAFPLTPFNEEGFQEDAFISLIRRLVVAKVNSIGVLGSTGAYAYLNRQERAQVIELALEHARGIPVMAGIGALRVRDILLLAEDAQRLGVQAVMLAPMSYHKLTEDEVFDLYKTVTDHLSIPLCIYDNPGTTNFKFTDELLAQIAQLPFVRSIKIPPISAYLPDAKKRVDSLRKGIPSEVSIGISGDWSGLDGLRAGCDLWYSAIGGLIPETLMDIVHTANQGDFELADRTFQDMEVILDMFRRYGSIRVIACAAKELGIVNNFCLPPPLKPLPEVEQSLLRALIHELQPA